jgi:hypothetical protein
MAEENQAAPGTTGTSTNELPEASFDPTPDTNLPLPGHTSFDRDAQTARVAADKGKRIRQRNQVKR